jgi:Flp pilus assembly protein TadD
MTTDKSRTVPRRHLIRALLGREIPAATAGQPGPDASAGSAAAPHAAGDAAYAAGDFAAAVTAYRATVPGDLSNIPVRSRLGYALYATGQFIQARVEFEHGLRLTNGEDAFCRLGLGLTLLALGKTGKAADLLEAFDAPDLAELTALARRIADRLREAGDTDPTPLRLTLERSARAMAFLPETGTA